ncbi:helix-turn-helix domain-containing protein [Streptomyces acidiscabies]|uniref:helix-turn-helix domain-containing protein n=1 Tax=Streptomyces acidiscabies TaxID=42234 RepID=UPI0038F6C348
MREDRQAVVGRKALARERAEYFRLMDQGFTHTEACRIVGIDQRTGKRWRNGRRARHSPKPSRTAHSTTDCGRCSATTRSSTGTGPDCPCGAGRTGPGGQLA